MQPEVTVATSRHAAATSRVPTDAPQPATEPTRAPAILVVDDDPDMCDLIAACLGKAGYEVLVAEDGPAAFELIKHQWPALFLLDCDLPIMSGFEICERLRAMAQFAEHPVIFITGLTDTANVLRGFQAGGVDFVRKPMIVPELLARIRTHLELASSRAALARRANLLEELTLEQDERLQEVRVGQEQLLPRPEDFADLDLAVEFRPAHVAGGDFYEVKRLAEDEIALFVADVSGHDLSMPFITGALKALTASFLNEVLSPVETMIQLNASLLRFLTDGRFVSACYARLSLSQMTVELINAGHPYPLLQRRGRTPEPIELVGDVLGMFDTARFETVQCDVRPGDRLFLYTDGLTEGFPDTHGRRGRALQGLARVRELLDGHGSGPLDDAVRNTVAALQREAGAVLDDDVLLMGIEF